MWEIVNSWEVMVRGSFKPLTVTITILFKNQRHVLQLLNSVASSHSASSCEVNLR